jgi:ribonuclease Z
VSSFEQYRRKPAILMHWSLLPMEITFLGTSSATPTRTRSLSAAALRLNQRREWWLFDCGEGTQHQLLRSGLSLSRLSRVFITHLHGDHIYGLPGLLASRSLLAGTPTPVTLHGPRGLLDFISCVFRVSSTRLAYPLDVREIEPGTVYEDAALTVEAGSMKHGAVAFGFAIAEKDRTGTFDVQRAQALGIPPGPLYGQLKRGETVVRDGRMVDGRALVGPPKRGRKVVFTGDTRFSPAAATLARHADVLVHEATYLEEDRVLAAERDHSTAAEAARIARQAGVHTLILTHLSPRYDGEEGTERVLDEARAIFKNTLVARDLWTHRLPASTQSTAE